MGGQEIAGVVLAAGFGTRLRPLTDLRPKALCPVDNVPLVDLALERLVAVASDVAVNVHHHREQLERHLAGRAHLSVEEREPLGTAGALGALRDWLGGRAVMVTNVDGWHRGRLSSLVESWDGECLRMLVTHDPLRGDFGPWRFAGTSLMPADVVAGLQPVPSGLYETCWAQAWEMGRLELVPLEGPFFACDTPADYLAANLEASGGRSVIGPGAVVEGEVVRSVVWPDSVVGRGERLVEAIRAGRDLTVQVRR
jgi:MurNAc alpha-1-phosphate uridylyltransferase